ncbi:hypothetical protein HGRIS_010615 [Hohenbuehelia grisea]|uniref:Prefoldin subunit 5 n=1 Tax=Hohenbuehelia grisea TaxID=104357 RepID=A0ABR3IXG9_9AGAR
MSQPQQQINVADLDLNQLSDVRRQLEEELSHLSDSFTQLKQAQSKFKACMDNVSEIKPQNKGNTILVPLTNSLYVPGKLSDPDHVIVDIGTGYLVQKTRAQAVKFYSAKVDYIRSNLETLEETLLRKRENMNYLMSIMQSKAQAQSQAKKS